MRMTRHLLTVALAFLAVPTQARIPVKLPCYEDCWQQDLESEGTSIVTEAKEVSKSLSARETNLNGPSQLEGRARRIEMMWALLDAMLEPADSRGRRTMTPQLMVLADFSEDYPKPEVYDLLDRFKFLHFEGGSGGWGIAIRFTAHTHMEVYVVLRHALGYDIRQALMFSRDPRIEAVARKACATQVVVDPRGPAEGAMKEEEEICREILEPEAPSRSLPACDRGGPLQPGATKVR